MACCHISTYVLMWYRDIGCVVLVCLLSRLQCALGVVGHAPLSWAVAAGMWDLDTPLQFPSAKDYLIASVDFS